MKKGIRVRFSNLFLVCFFALLISSCKEKTKLPGKREGISFSLVELDKSKYDEGNVVLGYSFISPTECLKQNFTNTNQYDGISSKIKLKRKWSVDFSDPGSIDVPLNSNVLVVKNKVFVADGAGTVYSIDVNTGKIIWKTRTSNKGISSGTFISYNNVNSLYVTTSFCDLFVIDMYSGKIRGVKTLSSPVKCPVVVDDNNLFVLSVDNKIACYGMRNLESLWEYIGLFEDSGIIGLAQPAINNDMIIATSKSGEVFALNTKNGALFWDYSICKSKITDANAFITQIKASPVIYSGNVYIVSNVGKTCCLSLNKGEVIWNNADFGGIKTPFVSGNAMFMIDSYGTLVALNNRSGKVFWKKNLNRENHVSEDSVNNISWFGPIVTLEGVTVFADTGDCLVFSHSNGKLLKKIALGHRIVAAPLLLRDKMILISNIGISCFQ